MTERVRFLIDGQEVTGEPGETIFTVAKRYGVLLPHLCHHEGPDYRADGNCRACVVEIEGERALAASCIRQPAHGICVRTVGERVERARTTVFELLAATMPPRIEAPDPDAPFWRWAETLQVDGERLRSALLPSAPVPVMHDGSHAAIAVNLDACIACGLCARACREVQVNDVIGMGFSGVATRPVFDLDDPLGRSTCVACGECVQVCPTGALLEKDLMDVDARRVTVTPEREVDTLCPYCGVGCQTRVAVAGERIVRVDGRDGPSNHNRLCVKGRFGFDYVMHADRLAVPLVRREGVPKNPNGILSPDRLSEVFREASWEEALDHAVRGLVAIRDRHGGGAIAGFGSAKGSNEEAFLFQKLIRQGFRTNNVDHCTRLCHASSVAALIECIGSGAVTAPFTAAENADCIIVIGARPTENHPVAANILKRAKKRGATLIVIDPRGHELMRHATHAVRFRAGTDVALLDAMLNVIVTEGLIDEAYIRDHVDGYDLLAERLRERTPEVLAPVCGVDVATIRTIARAYATAERALIFWGMGISQHVHGTDNARCLIALALITGHVGRPGTGLHPLRGQNNVQGASDAGLIPMMYPDYHPVEDSANRLMYEAAWGRTLDPSRGLTVTEILEAARAGSVRGMLVMGENPAMSDPDQSHAREALAMLDHLVVQDIFPTETAWFADVILPASAHAEKLGTFTNTNRQVQLARPVRAPPGAARLDLDILVALSDRLGLGWRARTVPAVYEEMRAAMPSLAGLPYDRLEREGAVTYPAPDAFSPGRDILFAGGFPTASGRARIVPADPLPPDEVPDADFPFVLDTGRLLEHWHTGVMTRRAHVLDEIEPAAIAVMNPRDAARLGLAGGTGVRVATRRGAIEATLRLDRAIAEGTIFIPFAFAEGPANRLTNPALDPFGKIPELKFCAARVEAVAFSPAPAP